MNKSILGRVELIDFPDSDIVHLHAKIDTGAYRSSVWATDIREENSVLYFRLLGKGNDLYNGKELSTKQYKIVKVENSFGHSENRHSVFLSVRIGGKRIKSNFTLASRESKMYPVLIGRKLLKNRFIVDVSRGDALRDEEITGDDSLE